MGTAARGICSNISKGCRMGSCSSLEGPVKVNKDRLVKEPRHTPTWLPSTSGCMGLEGREEPRWWLIIVLVPVKAAVEKCRQARDLELYVRIEFKMISGGPCGLKKMGDIYADKKTGEQELGKV